jgi:hypothetical protein
LLWFIGFGVAGHRSLLRGIVTTSFANGAIGADLPMISGLGDISGWKGAVVGVPSGLAGAVLFVVLLWPGFAYNGIRARNRPGLQLSPLQEIVTIVSASLVALAATGLLFGIARVAWPGSTPDVHSLLFDPHGYLEHHYVLAGWWAIGLLAIAVGGSIAAALAQSHPRVVGSRWLRPLMGQPDQSTMSAWWIAFSDRDPRSEHIHVGCALDDGTYITGRLHSFSQLADDVADRDLVLRPPLSARPSGGTEMQQVANAALMTISARHIVSMTVTYVRRPGPVAPAATTPPPAPSAVPGPGTPPSLPGTP